MLCETSALPSCGCCILRWCRYYFRSSSLIGLEIGSDVSFPGCSRPQQLGKIPAPVSTEPAGDTPGGLHAFWRRLPCKQEKWQVLGWIAGWHDYRTGLKTTGGLTWGGGMTESQRLVWLLSTPACAQVNCKCKNLLKCHTAQATSKMMPQRHDKKGTWQTHLRFSNT